MPFYIRKSVSAGPFRFNFSKSGVGLSVGVRGFRVGTGPRGHYVHAGRGGLCYRSSLGRAGEKARRQPHASPAASSVPAPDPLHHPTVEMVEVESSDVMAMADSRFQTILDDLNSRAQQPRMSVVLGGAAAATWFIWGMVVGFSTAAWLLLIVVLAALLGAYLDAYKRASVVFYDLEGDVHEAYLRFVNAFEGLAACAGKWHVAAGGIVRDLDTWKRNAGAGHLVKKAPTLVGFGLPSVVKSNVTPPSVAVGKQVLFFMPDVILVGHGNQFGVVPYEDLRISAQLTRFIEDGHVPSDAQVVDYTWRFVNKNGTPDRRFNNNHQIPICLYEAMHLSSSSGLNELLEFSKTDVVERFRAAVLELTSALKRAAKTKPPLLEHSLA